jgi:Family of unknown function (DUF5670)
MLWFSGGRVVGARWYASCVDGGGELGAIGARPGSLRAPKTPKEDEIMDLLWVVAVVFVVLWGFGFFAFHVTSGLIHLLLVVALVAVVFRLVTGRRLA